MTEIVEYDEGTDLVQRPAAGLFGTDEPDAIMEKAANVARVLKGVIVQQKLTVKIGGRGEYVLFEGLTTLAALVGVSVKTEYTRPTDSMGWEAAAVVVNQQGVEIGRAEAECLRNEKNWKNRDDYALRSMAQTRAAAKALRMQLGFIVVLAGYDPVPADEMPVEDVEIPFDSGPVQDPAKTAATDTAGEEAHGRSGTGGASEPRERLMQLARKLNAERQTELLIKKHAADNDPATHRGWLRAQIVRAEQTLAEREAQSQFQIPEGAQ